MVDVSTIFLFADKLLIPIPSFNSIEEIKTISNLGAKYLTPIVLNPSETISNSLFSIGRVLDTAWIWILNNVLVPILVLLFTALFFVGQYYLIKIYIWVGKNLYSKLFEIYLFFHSSPQVERLARKSIQLFSTK